MNKLVIDTLTPLGVPVTFQEYDGSATTYITFFFFNEQSDLNADDEELKTGYSLQVDVWSKSDYMNLVDQVKQAMKNAGFTRTFAADLYEKDNGIYHKVIRFRYSK